MATTAAEAITAVNRPITTGTEGDLGFLATLRTGGRMHLTALKAATATGATRILLFASRPAIRTASGFIGKTLFGKEVLLGCTESKILITIPTGKRFVLRHGITPQNNKLSSCFVGYIIGNIRNADTLQIMDIVCYEPTLQKEAKNSPGCIFLPSPVQSRSHIRLPARSRIIRQTAGK